MESTGRRARHIEVGIAGALGACLVLGVMSLLVASGMGYDPWAWLVWGRELLGLDLHTEGGPSWKPLPVILIAPFTPLGGLAPEVWLAFARAAAFAALFFAWRITVRISASRLAGLAAAASLAVAADFFVTALRGYSEPLLIALVLAAVDQHLEGRRDRALALGALAGLLRPEVWAFTGAYGLILLLGAPERRERVRVIALAAAAPALWLALDWAGSGNALESSDIATTSPLGSAAKSSTPALSVIERAADAVVVPVLAFAFAGLAVAARRVWRRREDARDRAVVLLAALAVGWIALVAFMAELGFTGRRRYLAVAAAILCVVAAVGAASLLERVGSRRLRQALTAAAAVVFLAFAFSPARTDYHYIALASDQADQVDELDAAVDELGADRVRALGRAVVNPFVQTALAWELDQRLDRVEATWSSSRRRPGWSPPAVLFRAPAKLAGTRPAIPPGTRARLLARSGRWRVSAAR